MTTATPNDGREGLLPCPFCHQAAAKVVSEDMHTHMVQCEECEATGPTAPTEGWARHHWNHPADRPEQEGNARAAPRAPIAVHVSGSPDMPADVREGLAEMIGHVVVNGIDGQASAIAALRALLANPHGGREVHSTGNPPGLDHSPPEVFGLRR